ncbi:hypothetical protein A0J61_10480, partial [Choanephora cucurbitarum]
MSVAREAKDEFKKNGRFYYGISLLYRYSLCNLRQVPKKLTAETKD